MSTKTAIIIGAGPAGITAALELLKIADYHPVILEESFEVGGISRTVEYNGRRMDLGGHRFFSKSDRVMSVWRAFMPVQNKPARDENLLGETIFGFGPAPDNSPVCDPEREDRLWLVRRRVSRIVFLRKFFDYPISVKPRTFINLGARRTVKAGFSFLAAKIKKREENSLADFMINRFGKVLYRMFFEGYNEKLWGINPTQMEPDWGAQRIKGLSLSKAVWEALRKPFAKKDGDIAQKNTETSLIERFLYPKLGPGQLWRLALDEVLAKGGEVRFGAKVTGITAKDVRVTAVEYEQNGDKFAIQADVCLSSMPVKDLIAAISADKPAKVAEVANALPYRDFMTVGLLVKRLKIKNKTKIRTVGDIVPDTWIYVQEPDVKLGRIQLFNNWSPYLNQDITENVWLGLEYFCNEGDVMWEMPDEDFISFAADELASIGIIDRGDVLDACRIRVKKAYPAYFGAYKEFGVVREYLDGFANLYCIGRNGQHRYNNMDHSMLTAMEAVANIKNGATDKSKVWNVNTEEDYHELKVK
ncbi:MAG: NAD(P)/FAD-dependent oxidoreductase [Oscillospiraceae bacterium]|jgi:protoporphyrinogen oxidase|nr:NAD(P)/FAD-dependent oxidoreductase [Oscillospiraceae bacterium]